MVLVLERELVLVMLGRSACLRLELAFPVLTMEDRRLASVVEAPTRIFTLVRLQQLAMDSVKASENKSTNNDGE